MGDTAILCVCGHEQAKHEGLQRKCMGTWPVGSLTSLVPCSCEQYGCMHDPEPLVADNINHPTHYTSSPAKCSGCAKAIECIDVVRHLGFNIGNAIKYLWRCDLKGAPVEDLKKAAWYIADEIRRREVKP